MAVNPDTNSGVTWRLAGLRLRAGVCERSAGARLGRGCAAGYGPRIDCAQPQPRRQRGFAGRELAAGGVTVVMGRKKGGCAALTRPTIQPNALVGWVSAAHPPGNRLPAPCRVGKRSATHRVTDCLPLVGWVSAAHPPRDGAALFAAVAFLRGIHFIEIPARFR